MDGNSVSGEAPIFGVVAQLQAFTALREALRQF
jgi:hypothetical protein